jgi:hypothetical protein
LAVLHSSKLRLAKGLSIVINSSELRLVAGFAGFVLKLPIGSAQQF